jgi:hypothetical protein
VTDHDHTAPDGDATAGRGLDRKARFPTVSQHYDRPPAPCRRTAPWWRLTTVVAHPLTDPCPDARRTTTPDPEATP